MKVKNIFSNRKNKKKKNLQQTSSAGDVNASHGDKLIISPDGNTSGKENEISDAVNNINSVTSQSQAGDNVVVLRSKGKKGSRKSSDKYDLEITKDRASSTSSNNSAKVKSRRPWSFIDQLRRQDSRESAYSTSSSARTSQLVDDFISVPPARHEEELLVGDSPALTRKQRRARDSGACTLPRSLTPERFEQVSTAGGRKSADGNQDYATKRRTMDFRFLNFFKRSSSGDSAPSEGSLPSNSGRSSLRAKNKGKKKGSKKKREPEDFNQSHPEFNSRMRSFSNTSQTITNLDDETQIPPPGLYDSDPKLNYLDERPEPDPTDKRVPINGEPAFYLGDNTSKSSFQEAKGNNLSRKYMRRSDPTSSHSILRSQTSDTSSLNLVRSTSNSTESSSRRSSTVCEPRDSPLPEDSIASFDSSALLAARAKKIHMSGSVPQIPNRLQNQRVQRALSNEMPQETVPDFIVQARCSQSVSNLTVGSIQPQISIPRSSSDADKPKNGRRLPTPSPHQQKQDKDNALRAENMSTSADFIAPPSPVLRAIGYPPVVFRRKNHKRNNQRPNSAYADQRTQHVLSLNMEDLPTYSRMWHEMTKNGSQFPSSEDILAVRESAASTKRGSGGSQYGNTASSRARRRGATLSAYGQRASMGFSVAASVDDLDSLSSSTYGSKQSLSDLPRMDDDELLNAFLARSHASTHTSSGNLRHQEPSSKRAKAIRKSVVSLANLISPGKPNQKSSSKLQRSSSFKESGSAVSSSTAAVASFKPYRPPSNTPNKLKNNRRSKLWCETFDHTGLNEREIKWQEAIFELYQGERDLVQDLTMAKQTYRDSMVTLKMLSDEEVTLIFGKLGCLLPLHEELLNKLEQARGEDGRTLSIGYIFVEWFPRISTAYREYCANQADAKYALDAAVERDARVRDFLQRCLESPFSRKLDLWSYLDLPRTRLVKYPLLLQNVLKRTPGDMQEERTNLDKVMEIIGEIIERVDETTGEQQCRYIRSKLEYLDDKHKSSFVDNSRLMLCSGQLKNNRGTKMHVFLFEEAFVLTRQTTRSNKISYQVYRPPLPLRSLIVDANEGEKLSGSFRGGILSSEKVKHSFRVKSEELNVSYTLQASEEHDRKQWINAIQEALTKYKAKHPDAPELLATQISRRRATYDPSSNGGKKQAARAVLRSSSDKSNRSIASSTDKSSLQEESQEEDVSTTSDEMGPWGRTRSQTVNPSILASKSGSSISRKSSGSSTKSDKSTKQKQKESKKELDTQKLKEKLKGLELDKDGPPSPLRTSFKKKSGISRHFSLSGADKSAKPVIRTRSNDDVGKERNKCQRSRSLTSSPQMTKSTASRFGSKKHSQDKIRSSSLAVPNSAKPPIGPTSSPYSVRRTPSFNSQSIHEAQSTPNLTALARSTSFTSRRSSTRLNQLAGQNNCSSVGNLRKGLGGNSTSELRSSSVERRAEEAKLLRRVRSQEKPSSEGDQPEPTVPLSHESKSTSSDKNITEVEETSTPEAKFALPRAVSNLLPKSDIAIVCTPATPKDSPVVKNMHEDEVDASSTVDEILTITVPVEGDETVAEDNEIIATNEDLQSRQNAVEEDITTDQSHHCETCEDPEVNGDKADDDITIEKSEPKVAESQENDAISTSEDQEHSDDIAPAADDVTDAQSIDELMEEYQDSAEVALPAQNNEGDLISFKNESEIDETTEEMNEKDENVCERNTQDEKDLEAEAPVEAENNECNLERETVNYEGIENDGALSEEFVLETEPCLSQDIPANSTQDEDVVMEDQEECISTKKDVEDCQSMDDNFLQDVEMKEEIQELAQDHVEDVSHEEVTQVEDVSKDSSTQVEEVSEEGSTQVENVLEEEFTQVENVHKEESQVEDIVPGETTQVEAEESSDTLEVEHSNNENTIQVIKDSIIESEMTTELHEHDQVILEDKLMEDASDDPVVVCQTESCDIENNNVEQSDDISIPVNKTDGCSKNNDMETDTVNCCRTEISDENMNQMQNLQASV
ncbi:uncharacterized protein LOC120335619 isoform X1 [Styela clava]